jgi:hypothetical protein
MKKVAMRYLETVKATMGSFLAVFFAVAVLLLLFQAVVDAVFLGNVVPSEPELDDVRELLDCWSVLLLLSSACTLSIFPWRMDATVASGAVVCGVVLGCSLLALNDGLYPNDNVDSEISSGSTKTLSFPPCKFYCWMYFVGGTRLTFAVFFLRDKRSAIAGAVFLAACRVPKVWRVHCTLRRCHPN